MVTCFRMIHINVSDILNIQMSHLSGSIIYVQCSLPLIELSHFIKADFHTKTFITVDSFYGKYIYIHILSASTFMEFVMPVLQQLDCLWSRRADGQTGIARSTLQNQLRSLTYNIRYSYILSKGKIGYVLKILKLN